MRKQWRRRGPSAQRQARAELPRARKRGRVPAIPQCQELWDAGSAWWGISRPMQLAQRHP